MKIHEKATTKKQKKLVNSATTKKKMSVVTIQVQSTLPRSNPLELKNSFDLKKIWLTWGKKQSKIKKRSFVCTSTLAMIRQMRIRLRQI